MSEHHNAAWWREQWEDRVGRGCTDTMMSTRALDTWVRALIADLAAQEQRLRTVAALIGRML